MIYKISYVIIGGQYPGAIVNQDHAPYIGEKVQIGELWYAVQEIKDLLPPQGDFAYLHATCQPTKPPAEQN